MLTLELPVTLKLPACTLFATVRFALSKVNPLADLILP